MIILETDEYIIEYKADLKTVIQSWRKFTSPENFRKAIKITLDFFKENEEIFFIISNTQKHGVISKVDANWVTEIVNPQLIENGLRKIIFIEPENIFAKYSVAQFLDENQGDEIVLKVPKIEFAEAWIKQYLEKKSENKK